MSHDQSGKHEHVSDTTIRDLARGRFTGTETARKNNIARITECAECTAKYNDPVFINPPMATHHRLRAVNLMAKARS